MRHGDSRYSRQTWAGEYQFSSLDFIFGLTRMTYHLLFVCLGNICRSPSAENIMRHLIKQEGLEDVIRCDSAGTSSYHIGASPDARMARAAAKRGLSLSGEARQFTVEDFEQFDLILAMDYDNYQDILAIAPSKSAKEKVQLICDFAKDHPDNQVPDPYYGGPSGFDYVIDLLWDACSHLLEHIRESQKV